MSQATALLISAECSALERMLLEKNRKYGDAALHPIAVGGVVVPPETGLLVRIGDKLKRWQAAAPGEDEDIVQDLLGYLILLRCARRKGHPQAPAEAWPEPQSTVMSSLATNTAPIADLCGLLRGPLGCSFLALHAGPHSWEPTEETGL